MDSKNELDTFDSQESFSDFWNQNLYSQSLSSIINDCENPPCSSYNTNVVSAVFDSTQFQQATFMDQTALDPTTNVGFNQSTLNQPAIYHQPLPADVLCLPLIPLVNEPGNYGFQIDFGKKTDSAPKSAPYTYSHGLKRLFVAPNTKCPIYFKCDVSPPEGSVIRATPVFENTDFASNLVTRCLQHRTSNKEQYFPDSHFIRVDMPEERNVKYELTKERRESVRLSFQSPLKGSEFSSIIYKFTCLSSCPGIDKKAVVVVFQLESNEGEVLARKMTEVRVCTCTGRDRRNQETKVLQVPNSKVAKITKKRVKPSSNMQVKVKKEALSDSEEEVFNLQVKGKKHYEMLKEIRDGLVSLKSKQAD